MKQTKNKKYLLILPVLVLLAVTITGCTKVKSPKNINTPSSEVNQVPVDKVISPEVAVPPIVGSTPPLEEMPTFDANIPVSKPSSPSVPKIAPPGSTPPPDGNSPSW